jgi:hypothetical protein
MRFRMNHAGGKLSSAGEFHSHALSGVARMKRSEIRGHSDLKQQTSNKVCLTPIFIAVKITMEEILKEPARGTGMTIRGLLGKARGRMESRLRAQAPM